MHALVLRFIRSFHEGMTLDRLWDLLDPEDKLELLTPSGLFYYNSVNVVELENFDVGKAMEHALIYWTHEAVAVLAKQLGLILADVWIYDLMPLIEIGKHWRAWRVIVANGYPYEISNIEPLRITHPTAMKLLAEAIADKTIDKTGLHHKRQLFAENATMEYFSLCATWGSRYVVSFVRRYDCYEELRTISYMPQSSWEEYLQRKEFAGQRCALWLYGMGSCTVEAPIGYLAKMMHSLVIGLCDGYLEIWSAHNAEQTARFFDIMRGLHHDVQPIICWMLEGQRKTTMPFSGRHFCVAINGLAVIF